MSKNLIKIFLVIVVLAVGILALIVTIKIDKSIDTIKYNGKTYVLLEYNMDIFTYNHNNSDNKYYEEDVIHPIVHKKWDIIYFNGDLFILNSQIKNATKYYNYDDNYNWYIVFEDNDLDINKNISISRDELVYLYDIEDIKDKITITFNDIDMFADILKITKDGIVQGIVTLAQVDGDWYYKTEIMTDDDREYVIRIKESLNEKINKLVAEYFFK